MIGISVRKSGLFVTASTVAFVLASAIPAAAQTATPVDAQTQAPGTDTAAPIGSDTTTGAVAQTVAPEANAGSDIVVTGSRIARPTLNSPIPVTTVTQADLTRTGAIVIGDVLNDLPSLRSTYSQANSTQFIGTAGINLLDLRGLGPTRTLVLVNGRRHITGSTGDFLVDTNTIPTDLIDRVDIVTGGSSAVYGSDAMAGVVNFVLKRNFDGVSLNAQNGIADNGNRGTYRLSGTFGKNFAEGRGNIALGLEYNQADLLTYADRPELTGIYSGRSQITRVAPNGAGVPERTFLKGLHSFGYDNGGNFIPYGDGNLLDCNSVAAACRANGAPRVFGFGTDGTLSEYNYGNDLRPSGNNSNQNGSGPTLRDKGTLNPGLKRYVANLIGHFDVSEAFKPFFEAKFVRVDSYAQATGTFNQGGSQGDGAEGETYLASGIPVAFDNAYLNPQAAATIRSLLPAGLGLFPGQPQQLRSGDA